MGMMEEIRERARAEAELLPPSLAKLNDMTQQLDQLRQCYQIQQAQLDKLLKMVNAVGLLLKKQQPQPKKEKTWKIF